MTKQKLLTIAIPTYNRSFYLDLCLKSILCDLPDDYRKRITVLILDNCSQDETQTVVEKARQTYDEIDYVRHSENIGPDPNFMACFHQAKTRYVQILGDDDLWLPGRLVQLLDLLDSDQEFGVIQMKAASFLEDPREAFDKRNKPKYKVYHDSNHFLYTVGLSTTLISACVFNKDIVKDSVDPQEYIGTCFIQLSWVLPAAMKAKQNVFMQQRMIAYKKWNQGPGYRLFAIFGYSLIDIFEQHRSDGIKQIVIDRLKAELMHCFFPEYIKRVHAGDLDKYIITEGIVDDLDKAFGNHWIYSITLRSLANNAKPEGLLHKLVRKSLRKWHIRYLNWKRGQEQSKQVQMATSSVKPEWSFINDNFVPRPNSANISKE